MKKKIQERIDKLHKEIKALEEEYLHYVLVMDWKIAIAKMELLTELLNEL